MEYIIGGLVILFGLFIIGYLTKKKYYKEIDRLESWKMDITNRPVLDEMSKVKQLNMTGETEELFERWRNEWDDIVTAQLPDVEEYLFDAEELIDKYRFRKAKEVQSAIDAHLKETEEKIQTLLTEINELVGSEEKNRTEMEELKEIYRERKKTILAHRHLFGQTVGHLEKLLDDVSDYFQQFEERTANGDYLKAREIVLSIKSNLETTSFKMESIPNLLVECQSNLPSMIHEVQAGYKEMLQQGYILDHIQLEIDIERLEAQLKNCLQQIENAEIEGIRKEIDEIKESIDVLYDLLEKEVHAKHFIYQNEEKTKELLSEAYELNNGLKVEIQQVLQGYHLQEKELEEQHQLEKQLRQIFTRFELLEHKIGNESIPYTLVGEELSELKTQAESIKKEQETFAEKMQMLRKDELAAREKVKELSKQIAESIRLLTKSNVPGLPQGYKYLLDDAKESIQNVTSKLEEKPLDIPTVQKYLEISVMTVEKVHETTIELLETVKLAEKVIQYGNRYRSRFPSVHAGLKEAESAFRSFNYQNALEQAATSIEKVEPGALKKIEELLSGQNEITESKE